MQSSTLLSASSLTPRDISQDCADRAVLSTASAAAILSLLERVKPLPAAKPPRGAAKAAMYISNASATAFLQSVTDEDLAGPYAI